jgi:hypothetical protein
MGDMEDGTQGNLSAFGTANRPGIPRSLNDIEYFYDAANFAAFIVAGGTMERRWRHKNDRRQHKLKFKIGF